MLNPSRQQKPVELFMKWWKSSLLTVIPFRWMDKVSFRSGRDKDLSCMMCFHRLTHVLHQCVDHEEMSSIRLRMDEGRSNSRYRLLLAGSYRLIFSSQAGRSEAEGFSYNRNTQLLFNFNLRKAREALSKDLPRPASAYQ